MLRFVIGSEALTGTDLTIVERCYNKAIIIGAVSSALVKKRNFASGRHGMVVIMMAFKKIINSFRLLLFSSTLIIGIILIVLFWRFADIDQQLLRMIIALDLFGGVFGLVFFVCIYAAFTVCLIPTLPMNVLAGFICCGWNGGLISCWRLRLVHGSVLLYQDPSCATGDYTKPIWLNGLKRTSIKMTSDINLYSMNRYFQLVLSTI